MESEYLTDSTPDSFEYDFMASTLAHEIRNPLQAMRIQIDSAIRGASATDAIAQISKSLDRLEKVMNKVQRLSVKYQLKPRICNLQELVEEAVEGSRIWLQAAGIEVDVSTKWEGRAIVEIDSDLFEQVVLNLVANAVQAMPKGGTLRIRISECADSAEITVTDTGHGIDRSTLSKIGTPFFTTRTNGSGLGLAFCKTIVAMHGGEIDFESELGRGTSVHLRLPKSAKKDGQ